MDERLILRVRQMTSFGLGLVEVTKKLVGECSPEMVFLAFHAARLLDCPQDAAIPTASLTTPA